MENESFSVSRENQLMAQILPLPIGKSKTKLHSVKVDMTPMVDLGFLLITFFIFTSTMAEPTVTKLTMPAQEGTHLVQSKKLLTLLLDKQKVVVYPGEWNAAKANNQVRESTYHLENGVGNTIREKQQFLAKTGEEDDLMIAIKPTASASYQDVLNALDEMKINGVKRYGIMKITEEETAYMKAVKQ
jgi:biopolymer transport protein ExbD